MRGVFTTSRSKSQCQDAQSYSPTAPGNDRQRILQLSMRTEKRLVFTLGKVLELDAAFPSDQRTPVHISVEISERILAPDSPSSGKLVLKIRPDIETAVHLRNPISTRTHMPEMAG